MGDDIHKLNKWLFAHVLFLCVLTPTYHSGQKIGNVCSFFMLENVSTVCLHLIILIIERSAGDLVAIENRKHKLSQNTRCTYVICRCVKTYIHTYIHTCMHAYIHTCMHTYIHTYNDWSVRQVNTCWSNPGWSCWLWITAWKSWTVLAGCEGLIPDSDFAMPDSPIPSFRRRSMMQFQTANANFLRRELVPCQRIVHRPQLWELGIGCQKTFVFACCLPAGLS